jgi:hypothetical protein
VSITPIQSFQQYKSGGYELSAGEGLDGADADDGEFLRKELKSCSEVSITSTAKGLRESLMLVLYCKQLAKMRRISVANAATEE